MDLYVGIMLTADPSASLLFTLTGGNVNDAFRVQNCSGIIFVNKNILDYETLNFYNLTITILGDLATNASALVYVLGPLRS